MIDVKSGQEQWHIRTLTYRGADALVIVCGWWIATRLLNTSVDVRHAFATTITIVVFHFVGEITGMYRNWRGVNVDKEVMCAILTWLITAPIVISSLTLMQAIPIETQFLRIWLMLIAHIDGVLSCWVAIAAGISCDHAASIRVGTPLSV